MRQPGRYPQDCVELHDGQADPVYAAADLDDATEVAQADNAADARELPASTAPNSSSTVGADLPLTRTATASERVLADDDVAALFGLEMDAPFAANQKAERGGTQKARRGSKETAAATRPAGDAKPIHAKKEHASGALAPARSLAAKTRARQTGESIATTKPPPEPKSPAAPRPKRGSAALTPASNNLPPSAELKAAKSRRFDPRPVGRARAAKWIGAKRRKADR